MKRIRQLAFVATLLLVVSACGNRQVRVEGHYTYKHDFEYDMDGNHFDVSETGTMDFYPDGSALDSARQVYVVTLSNGDTVTWVSTISAPANGDWMARICISRA